MKEGVYFHFLLRSNKLKTRKGIKLLKKNNSYAEKNKKNLKHNFQNK